MAAADKIDLEIVTPKGKALSVTVDEVTAPSVQGEFGILPGYDVTTWYGVFGPPGMSASVVDRLNKTLREIIADEKVRARLVAAGVVVHGSGAAEFGAFMGEEYKRWDAVREAAGVAQQ